MTEIRQTQELSDYLSAQRFDDARQAAEGEPKLLLLTCIDYRFFDGIHRALRRSGLAGRYDHFILAGASLGAMLDFPAGADLPEPAPALPRVHWRQVLLEHLQIIRALHPTIDRALLIEHQECGAYDTFLGRDHRRDRDTEHEAHRLHACRLKQLIGEHHSAHFKIDALMALLPDPHEPDRCPILELDCG